MCNVVLVSVIYDASLDSSCSTLPSDRPVVNKLPVLQTGEYRHADGVVEALMSASADDPIVPSKFSYRLRQTSRWCQQSFRIDFGRRPNGAAKALISDSGVVAELEWKQVITDHVDFGRRLVVELSVIQTSRVSA